MSRQLRCPNCGGEHSLVNPGITMLVCSYCKTIVYWSADAVLKTGVQAILPEADTRLHLHATGKLRGSPAQPWRTFEVAGHVRYDYGRGTWDEWYLQLADGGVAWLSEDERELTLEQAARVESAVPPPDRLRLGHPVALDGVTYTVRELGTATCVGGEGQLPFTILPGERTPYADLASADGTRFATLELDGSGAAGAGEGPGGAAATNKPGGVHGFAGVVLDHEQLVLDDEPPPSTAGGREAKQITCPNCAAPLAHASRGRDVKTVICEYCGAQNALEGAEARVAGVNPKGFEPGFVFAIGDGANLRGARYEVCGRLLYTAEGDVTREYLLHNTSAGYLWLSEENGHYVLNRPTQQAPSQNAFALRTRQSVTAGPTTFRFYESGTIELVYVDGAIPWLAASGEHTTYADLIAPPQMLSVESDGEELECFVGQYMPPEQVWAAFERPERAPRPDGVHGAQPFARGPLAKALMVVGGIFALINLGLFGWSFASNGTQIFEQTFQSGEYLGETLSRTFDVGRGRVMGLSLDAPLRDSWLALNVGLVDAQEQVVQELEGDVSLYSGVEEGESWSEGSSTDTTYFRAPLPGTYRLVLKASGGSGLSGPCLGEALTVRLHQGAILSRYFLAACILAFLFPLFELSRQYMFEKRRWGPVTEDDDDDGGDDD